MRQTSEEEGKRRNLRSWAKVWTGWSKKNVVSKCVHGLMRDEESGEGREGERGPYVRDGLRRGIF